MSSPRKPAARPAPPDAFTGVLLRVLAIPLLIVGAAVLFGAILAPSAGVAATMVRTIDDSCWTTRRSPTTSGSCRSGARSSTGTGTGWRSSATRTACSWTLDEVPEHVQQAIIATEDQDFYTHEGVNWRSVVRAAAGNVPPASVTSGASTLTQQLVKNLVLETNEQTLDRKLQEAVYAIALEKRMSKDEILEQYLNTAYFGNGVYGIGAAAEFYWGKTPAELTVSDGAMLAGMLRAPERNEPLDHPDNAIARREIVLRQMASLGFIADARGGAPGRPSSR
jgi:membrane peptidoglycan carboxypeptidase